MSFCSLEGKGSAKFSHWHHTYLMNGSGPSTPMLPWPRHWLFALYITIIPCNLTHSPIALCKSFFSTAVITTNNSLAALYQRLHYVNTSLESNKIDWRVLSKQTIYLFHVSVFCMPKSTGIDALAEVLFYRRGPTFQCIDLTWSNPQRIQAGHPPISCVWRNQIQRQGSSPDVCNGVIYFIVRATSWRFMAEQYS